MTTVDLHITGMRTSTGLNAREHWRARAARVQHEHNQIDARLSLQFKSDRWGDPGPFRKAVGPGPYVVTLTRCSPRLADDDNAIAGLKSVRDRISKWLGTGDGPTSPVSWRYSQEQGKWGVKIRVEPRAGYVEARP